MAQEEVGSCPQIAQDGGRGTEKGLLEKAAQALDVKQIKAMETLQT